MSGARGPGAARDRTTSGRAPRRSRGADPRRRLAGDPRPRQVRAFTRRYLRQYTRSPLSLAFLVAWPTFWYLLVVHVLLGTAAGDAATVAAAKATYAVSFGLFGAFTVALNGVVGSFTADVQTKRYRKFRSLPVSPAADLAGRFLAGTALAALSYGGLLAVGVLDGAAFALRSPASPAIVALCLVAFSAVGVAAALTLAAAVPRPAHATTLATALLVFAFFGTGFNGAAPRLFPGPGWLLNVIPVTVLTRLQLYHLVDGAAARAVGAVPPTLPAEPAFLLLAVVYGGGSLALGDAVMRRLVYRGEVGE